MARILRVSRLERRYIFRISRALVFIFALFIALCYILQTFAVTTLERYAKNIDSHSNMSVIEVDALRPEAKMLDQVSLPLIQELNHVTAVSPWIQHDLDLADAKDWPIKNENPGALWATTYFEPRLPKMVLGERKQELDQGEIILPATASGGNLSHLYNKTIRFGFSHVDGKFQGSYRTIELKVVGLYDNSVPDKDGESASYVSLPTMKTLFDGTLPRSYTFAYVQVDSAQNSAQVQKELADLGFSVSGAAGIENMVGLIGVLAAIGNFVLPIVLVCTLGFGFFLSIVWIVRRKQDFALFRCMGYTAKDIACLIFVQVLTVSITASIIGIFIGMLGAYVLANLIFPQGASVYEILHLQIFDPLAVIQLLSVSAVGTIVGVFPFSVYLTRLSPDLLLRS